MTVRYYGPNEHPAGFVGFLAAVYVDGENRQMYFSTRKSGAQDETDLEFMIQKLKAERQSTDWEIERSQSRYHRLLNEDDPKCEPQQGLGVQGMKADFVYSKGQWNPGFTLLKTITPSGARGGPKHIGFEDSLYSEAWREAVTEWATIHSVRDEDRDRLLASPPDPEQFKNLRRQINQGAYKETDQIPVNALSSVYREQREAIARLSQNPPPR